MSGLIGSIVGSVLGYEGVQSTNASNQAINSANIAAQEATNATTIANSNMELDMSRQYDAQQTQGVENYNAGQAQLGRDFAEQTMTQAEDYDTVMSDTARQRGVADMKAAGLNPILAASSGGASTPSLTGMTTGNASAGAIASPMASPNLTAPRASIPMENPMAGLISGAKQGADITSTLQNLPLDLKSKQATIDNLQSMQRKNDADAALSNSNSALTAARTVTEAADQGLIDKKTAAAALEPQLMRSQGSAADATAYNQRMQGDYTDLQRRRVDYSYPATPQGYNEAADRWTQDLANQGWQAIRNTLGGFSYSPQTSAAPGGGSPAPRGLPTPPDYVGPGTAQFAPPDLSLGTP